MQQIRNVWLIQIVLYVWSMILSLGMMMGMMVRILHLKHMGNIGLIRYQMIQGIAMSCQDIHLGIRSLIYHMIQDLVGKELRWLIRRF
mmetsp:Transcript_126081/g.299392  ORF Transcript_126081/g.299392 Transcript_126081/m.299392 type:complete len:88 (-) Transcript_126081:389-652(-)